MNNEIMKIELSDLKNKQESEINQLAKYKALIVSLDITVRERQAMIDLIESALNPEKRNDTLSQILRY